MDALTIYCSNTIQGEFTKQWYVVKKRKGVKLKPIVVKCTPIYCFTLTIIAVVIVNVVGMVVVSLSVLLLLLL